LDAENTIKTLEAQLEVQDALIESAQASYDKVLADPRSVDIAPFRAMVGQANALVMSAQASLDKTIIRAPVTGILSKKNVEIGEKVGGIVGNESFGADFQLIDDNDFYIEINIPETQVNKVERENEVSITFDSIDNENFTGTLVSIDPGATEIDGVIYYQADIKIVDEDERLKAGMTADLVLNAEPKVNVLVIPEIAVLTEDGEKWVRLPINGSTERYEKVPVRVGTRGNGGQIEVTSGLEEGQTILVPKV
jgi:HlyD family secretion protein